MSAFDHLLMTAVRGEVLTVIFFFSFITPLLVQPDLSAELQRFAVVAW